jgi:hypothetical protein
MHASIRWPLPLASISVNRGNEAAPSVLDQALSSLYNILLIIYLGSVVIVVTDLCTSS